MPTDPRLHRIQGDVRTYGTRYRNPMLIREIARWIGTDEETADALVELLCTAGRLTRVDTRAGWAVRDGRRTPTAPRRAVVPAACSTSRTTSGRDGRPDRCPQRRTGVRCEPGWRDYRGRTEVRRLDPDEVTTIYPRTVQEVRCLCVAKDCWALTAAHPDVAVPVAAQALVAVTSHVPAPGKPIDAALRPSVSAHQRPQVGGSALWSLVRRASSGQCGCGGCRARIAAGDVVAVASAVGVRSPGVPVGRVGGSCVGGRQSWRKCRCYVNAVPSAAQRLAAAGRKQGNAG